MEKYSIKVLTFEFPFGQSERPSERKLRVPPLCRVPSASSNPRNLDEKKKKRKQRRGTLNAFKRERFDPCKASSTVPRFRYRVSLSYFRPPFSPFFPTSSTLILYFFIPPYCVYTRDVYTWIMNFAFSLPPNVSKHVAWKKFSHSFKNLPLLSLTEYFPDNLFEFPRKKRNKKICKKRTKFNDGIKI